VAISSAASAGAVTATSSASVCSSPVCSSLAGTSSRSSASAAASIGSCSSGSTKSLTSSAEEVDSSTSGSMFGSSSFSDTRYPAFSTVNHGRFVIFTTDRSPRCLLRCIEAVRTTEYPGCTHTEQPVEQAHQRNYDDNEDQNNSGHLHQFLAGRSDDLAHLVDDLAQEHHNASNDPALASALGS